MNIFKYIGAGFAIYRLAKKAGDEVLSNIEYSWVKFRAKRDIKLLKEEIHLRLNVVNKNPFDLPITKLVGLVKHGGVTLAYFDNTSKITLRSNVKNVLTFKAKYTTGDVLGHLQGMMGGAGALAPLTVDWKLTATVKGKSVTVPFTHTVQMAIR